MIMQTAKTSTKNTAPSGASRGRQIQFASVQSLEAPEGDFASAVMKIPDFKRARSDLHLLLYRYRQGNEISLEMKNAITRAVAFSSQSESLISEKLAEIQVIASQQARMNDLIFECRKKLGEMYDARRVSADLQIAKRSIRALIFHRDGFKCVFCGSKTALTVDHIIPVKHNGDNSIENLQTLCRSCNSSKGAKLFGRKLENP